MEIQIIPPDEAPKFPSARPPVADLHLANLHQ